MRVSYWSNSSFADKLRKLAGISKQPSSATLEGWNEYESESRAISPTMHAVIEFLDKAQALFCWIPDQFDAAVYYVVNVKNESQYLRTRTKRGQWSDLVTKIPDALMFSVIDFVEKECFWMNVMCTEEPGILRDYAKQSYIKRKLFSIKISDSIRGQEGIKWIEWQIKASEGSSDEYYTPIIEAYKFAKERYFKFDAWEESGYNEAERAGVFGATIWTNSNKEDRSRFYKKIEELEAEFDDQVTLHCTNIVKHRKGLWT